MTILTPMATLGTVSLPKSAYLQVCKGHFYGNFMFNKVLLPIAVSLQLSPQCTHLQVEKIFNVTVIL